MHNRRLSITVDVTLATKLGQGLAMLGMRITLATIRRLYVRRVVMWVEMEYLTSFTLKPKQGLPTYVTRRTP